MRILYAEDDTLMQKMVAYSLIKFGHEVTTVDNGKEAIETLQEDGFDFVILDIFMPHVSGLEVADYIRNELKGAMPIIILTRNGSETLRQKASAIGVDGYLTKPIEPDALLIEIKNIIGTASA